MENKTGFVSLIFLIMSGIVIFSDWWFLVIPFFSIAILVPLTKVFWDNAGWMADKVEEMK